jgi:hypothetical protein
MITEEQFRMGRVRHEYEPGNEISTPMFDSAPKCRTCGGPTQLPIHRLPADEPGQYRFTVAAYMNCHRDNFDGLRADHPLWTDTDLVLELAASGPRSAADRAWDIGNRMGADDSQRSWPSDVRSLSVGDVLKVESGSVVDCLTVVGVDWHHLGSKLDNPIVGLDGADSVTSRGRA